VVLKMDLNRVGRVRMSRDKQKVAVNVTTAAGHHIAVENWPTGEVRDVTPTNRNITYPYWSPDSQWIAVVVLVSGKLQLVKIEPVASAIPISLTKAVLDDQVLGGPEWSPAGDWILYPSTEGMSLIFPDGASTRKLTSRKLMAYGFSRDGRQVYGVFQNTTGAGARWQLYAIDVSSGVEKMLAPVDLPASTTAIAGFSMHPDGQRFLRTIVNSPYDIWMLEGFDQPRSKTWLERLLRR